MENVQVIPFRISGDKKTLEKELLEEDNIDLDSVDQTKAILYAKPNNDDSVSNININVQLGSLGIFIYNVTLDERLLHKLYGTVPEDTRQKLTLDKLRYLFRCMLLEYELVTSQYQKEVVKKEKETIKKEQEIDINDKVIDINNCIIDLTNHVFESELVIIPRRKTCYKLYLNEKFQLSAIKNTRLNFNKRICELTITEQDILHDSNNLPIELDLNIEDYFYLLHSISEKRKYHLTELNAINTDQQKQIEFYTRQFDALRHSYEERFLKIQNAALQLVNSKKQKIRKLIGLLENYQEILDKEGIDARELEHIKYNDELQFAKDEDKLHINVEISASESELESESTPEKENTNRKGSQTKKTKKRIKPFKDRIVKRRKETFNNNEPSSSDNEQSDNESLSFENEETEDNVPIGDDSSSMEELENIEEDSMDETSNIINKDTQQNNTSINQHKTTLLPTPAPTVTPITTPTKPKYNFSPQKKTESNSIHNTPSKFSPSKISPSKILPSKFSPSKISPSKISPSKIPFKPKFQTRNSSETDKFLPRRSLRVKNKIQSFNSTSTTTSTDNSQDMLRFKDENTSRRLEEPESEGTDIDNDDEDDEE